MLDSFLARPRFSDPRPVAEADRQERTLAVLTGAEAVLRRGWLQGGWYVLEAPDGRRRFVGAGSLTRRSFGSVVQACLVGAVVEAGTRHSPEAGTAGPALDAVWWALMDLEGKRLDTERRSPSPMARRARVRELARWNDQPERTQEDVLLLLDTAISGVLAEARSASAVLVEA